MGSEDVVSGGSDAIISAFVDGLQPIGDALIAALPDVVNAALPVLGGVLVVFLGVRVAKNIWNGPETAAGDYVYMYGSDYDEWVDELGGGDVEELFYEREYQVQQQDENGVYWGVW